MKKDGKIGGAIIFWLMRPLAALPLRIHRKIGTFIGWMAGSVLRYRRDVVMTNLSRSFPDLKYHELKDICRKFYKHFGDIVGETVWIGGCSNRKRLEKSGIGEIKGADNVNRFLDAGKSVMVLDSHFGNWELFSGIFQMQYGKDLHCGAPDVCVSYRALSSKAWDRFFYLNRMAAVHPKTDGEVVESFDILRYALLHRNDTKIYIFITDQYPYSSSSCVPLSGKFLNQDTYVMNGCAQLAKKLGMPVVYMSMGMSEYGHYVVNFSQICDNAAESTAEDIMSEYFRLLETDIKAQPWNYLWTHKRWK